MSSNRRCAPIHQVNCHAFYVLWSRIDGINDFAKWIIKAVRLFLTEKISKS